LADAWELAALIGVGVTAFGGQILMTHAFRYGEAAFISAFAYVAVLASAVYGWVFFGEGLTLPTGLGPASSWWPAPRSLGSSVAMAALSRHPPASPWRRRRRWMPMAPGSSDDRYGD